MSSAHVVLQQLYGLRGARHANGAVFDRLTAQQNLLTGCAAFAVRRP
jgi:hypothetical protein